MLKRQAGDVVELLPRANGKYLEQQQREIARDVYQTIHTSSPDKFTSAWIDALCDKLNAILYELDQLPEAAFKELIEVIQRLGEARDELRLARFLFDVEEINPVHRLVMRSRAVLRGKDILHKVLRVWPMDPSS